MMHDMYFVEVNTPAESKGPWDYYKVKGAILADKAFPAALYLALPAAEEVRRFYRSTPLG
jgi:hypothetical protein